MRNIHITFSAERVQEAIRCLDEHDEEVNSLTGWRADYQTARAIILAKYLKLVEKEACMLLKWVDNIGMQSARKVQEVRLSVNDIQKDPYDRLVDQFIFAYNCFFKKHNLDAGAPIPKKFLDTPIFEYFTIRGEKQYIFLALAQILLNPRRQIDCRKFFMSAIEGTLLKM